MVSLRHEQQPRHLVLLPIPLEDAAQRCEPCPAFFVERALGPFGVAQIPVERNVAEEGALLVVNDELVDRRGELRAVLAEGPREKNRNFLFRSSRGGALREAVAGWNHAKTSGKRESRARNRNIWPDQLKEAPIQVAANRLGGTVKLS